MDAAAAITPARLYLFAAGCDVQAVAPALNDAFDRHGITTVKRVRHCMAHLYVESAGFTRLEEDLNYTAARLCAVWPKRFPNLTAAAPYAHNPQALAEKVYGGRMGNNEAGDGWRFRGRGYIDNTGRAAYGRATVWSGVDLVTDPDQLATPKVAALAAAGFWDSEGLNALADADDLETITAAVKAITAREADLVKQETVEINGGHTGLDERGKQLARAQHVWAG